MVGSSIGLGWLRGVGLHIFVEKSFFIVELVTAFSGYQGTLII